MTVRFHGLSWLPNILNIITTPGPNRHYIIPKLTMKIPFLICPLCPMVLKRTILSPLLGIFRLSPEYVLLVVLVLGLVLVLV